MFRSITDRQMRQVGVSVMKVEVSRFVCCSMEDSIMHHGVQAVSHHTTRVGCIYNKMISSLSRRACTRYHHNRCCVVLLLCAIYLTLFQTNCPE